MVWVVVVWLGGIGVGGVDEADAGGERGGRCGGLCGGVGVEAPGEGEDAREEDGGAEGDLYDG